MTSPKSHESVNQDEEGRSDPPAILSLKMWLCGTITTYVRRHSLQSPNQEDEGAINFFNRAFRVPTDRIEVLPDNTENHERVNRWLRICNNDVANIPIGLIVLLLAATYSPLDQSLLVALTWIFIAAHLAHTTTYAYAIQPWRTVTYSSAQKLSRGRFTHRKTL